VGSLHCVDASADVIAVARRALADVDNCRFHVDSVDSVALPEQSMDFGYSLGVLHHVPDTERGIAVCVRLLKPGAPFLLYLYYAFDNRPLWYRRLWQASDLLRRVLSRRGHATKLACSSLIAALVYLPLAKLARLVELCGLPHRNIPLSYYRERSLYTMRTDAYDRLGTPLEQRFTREEITAMMGRAGLDQIRFCESPPYWCAVGLRSRNGPG
jgi:ubiquinone/menaquinone biosynthesis C-methylase UbiE